MYKALNKLLPIMFQNYFSRRHDKHDHCSLHAEAYLGGSEVTGVPGRQTRGRQNRFEF